MSRRGSFYFELSSGHRLTKKSTKFPDFEHVKCEGKESSNITFSHACLNFVGIRSLRITLSTTERVGPPSDTDLLVDIHFA